MQTGARAQTLQGHGHWVNTLALSAEYALRTGPFDHTGAAPSDPAEAKQVHFYIARNAHILTVCVGPTLAKLHKLPHSMPVDYV